MIEVTVSGVDDIKRIIANVQDFANRGYVDVVQRGAEKVAEAVKDDMRNGMEHGSEPMAPLALSTLEGPIRRDGDSGQRKTYGYVPLYASGNLVNDIAAIKINNNEFEVTAKSELGRIKLASNSKTSHSGAPFAGDTPKPVRDPLQATDKRMDIIFDELVSGIERAIGL